MAIEKQLTNIDILGQSPVISISINREGIIDTAHGRDMVKLCAGKRIDLVGKYYKDVFTNEKLLAKINEALAGSLINTDVLLYNACFSFESSPLYDEGEQVGTLLYLTDISDKKKELKDLLGKELRFRTLFSVASDAIFMMDNKTFIDCNEATLKIFNCSHDQIVGQTPYRFSPEFQPDGRTSEEAAMEKINGALSGTPQFFEWQHIQYDGTPFDAEVSLNRIDIEDDVFIQAIVRDVTQRKLAEKEIHDSHEELTKINQELDRFVYSVSHDLRAPISSLLGIVEIIRKETDSESIIKLTELQEQSLSRLDGFIEDIVDYSRNTRLEIEKRDIDIAAEVNGVISQLSFMKNASSIDKVVKVDGNTTIVSDLKRIRIILNNLISNAIKYADLEKPNPYIHVIIVAESDITKIKIEDNGIGVPDDYRKEIFEMFFRATERGSGSGLGLYIVNETVTKLEGTISVASKLGQGSTFEITIPNGNKALT